MNKRFIFSVLQVAMMSLLFSCTATDGGSDDELTWEYPYSTIVDEEREDWDSGVQSLDGCIVASHDTGDNSVTYLVTDYKDEYYGPIGHNAVNGVLLQFDNSGELRHVLTDGLSIDILAKNDGCFIHWITDKGELYGALGDSSLRTCRISTSHSSDPTVSFFSSENINAILALLQKLQSVCGFGEDLISNDAMAFLDDLSKFDVSQLNGTKPQYIQASIHSLQQIIDVKAKDLYESQKSLLYGECKIAVNSVSSDEKGNIVCDVSIENINTIPSHLYHKNIQETDAEATNHVKWGLVGKKTSDPRSQSYTHPYKAEEHDIDINKGDVQNFQVTFPTPSDGEIYHFKAYLKSCRFANANGNVNDNDIRFSETFTHSRLQGEVTGFTQQSLSESNGDIVFKCSVKGFIKSPYQFSEWGFYYKDFDGNMTFFPSKVSPAVSSELNDTQEFTITIKKLDYDFDFYHAARICLGLYTKSSSNLNGLTHPQHFYVEYGQSEDGITYHYNPHEFVDLGLSVKWASSNIGAKHVIDPGYYLGWGELTQKANNVRYDKQHHSLSIPETNESGYVTWHYKDIGNSICGTNYDAATYHWGGSARMPSEEETKELLSKCQFVEQPYFVAYGGEYTPRGVWAVGPNKHAIFFPVSDCVITDLNHLTEYKYRYSGYFWTGTLATIGNSDYAIAFSLSDRSDPNDSLGPGERCRGRNVRAVCP